MSSPSAGSTVRVRSGEYRNYQGVVLAVYPRRFLFWRWHVASIRIIDRANRKSLLKTQIRASALEVLAVPTNDPRNIVTEQGPIE